MRNHAAKNLLFFLTAGMTVLAAQDVCTLKAAAKAAEVLVPEAPGTKTVESNDACVDISNLSKGYVVASYDGAAEKINVQLTGPDETTYKYMVYAGQEDQVFPLTAGDGAYTLTIYENLYEDQYALLTSEELDVTLENEFLPFLYPNQYVNFNQDNEAVKKAEELSEDCTEELEIVQAVFEYVTENITYDFDKAAEVTSGYLPDVDETLESGTGICFDYAALMTAMLRSQGIPTRLEIGYIDGGIYHSWISTYLEEQGWVDNIIQFNGESWEYIDPTMMASSDSEEDKEQVVKDTSNYIVIYSR